MYAIVVHESIFGNTRDIAEAVAAGLSAAWPEAVIDCVGVDALSTQISLPDADLVVVGAPTHFWGMTSRLSRLLEREYELRMMRAQPGHGRRRAVATTGVRHWLTTIPPGRGAAAASFDTRMAGAANGGAAPAIARRLRRRGYQLVAAPQAFYVSDIAGPLQADQPELAREWARQLAQAVPGQSVPLQRPSPHR